MALKRAQGKFRDCGGCVVEAMRERSTGMSVSIMQFLHLSGSSCLYGTRIRVHVSFSM